MRRLAVVCALLTVALALCGGPTQVVAAQVSGTGTGYLHTSGNQIVDSAGATVRLTGLNWFGMETDNKTFHGLWANVTWKSQIDHMAQLGYNTIRVPYSNDALKPGAVATGINDWVNPDLVGLSPLQILDRVIAYAGQKGMRIILDRHRPTSGQQTALWYTPAVSEATWINDWKSLAQRYADGIRAGAVFVNMPPIPDMAAPWGGYKASGWGREMGPWALDAYTEIKSVWLHYG
ncbi:aldehyde dehydrogenase family protein [Kibdelosporangium lantanae]|uniref:cellulase n=1 Tax=Kibdelosporangium lantanae TaxID=1497396 RepID=A0ABW3M7B1_9PSEU